MVSSVSRVGLGNRVKGYNAKGVVATAHFPEGLSTTIWELEPHFPTYYDFRGLVSLMPIQP